MKAYGMTDKGLVRAENQDAFVITTLNNGSFCCVVCDGMGGHNAGNVASSFAINKFIAALNLESQEPGVSPGDAIQHAALSANEAVFEAAATDPRLSGMGTTLVAAIVSNDLATIGNVGDSRAYHIRGSQIKQITNDHSLVAGLVQRGEITAEQAKSHPGRNLITRAVGTGHTVLCDTFEIPVEQGDYIFLCSDGLSNLINDDEILKLIVAADEKSCRDLLELTYQRGASDNVTVLIIEI